jgi:CHASE2 domain-containing sensor protein
VDLKTVIAHKHFTPAIGAGLTVLWGLALWRMPLGEGWVNASYDNLFRFGARGITNKVALILMDDSACATLGQVRTAWDRALHAELLNRLTEGGCSIVVFDVFFTKEGIPESDSRLAEAMRRHGKVVFAVRSAEAANPIAATGKIIPPNRLFADATTNWGIGQAELAAIPRRHWPFPTSEEQIFPSLPQAATRLAGAHLSTEPEKRWLRYYGENGGWDACSYDFALSNALTAFRNKVVFIGSDPQNKDPSFREEDKFCTPYTAWTQNPVGGVKILATTFLNLVNGDWLRRPPWWLEALVLIATGLLLGGELVRMRPFAACSVGAGSAMVVTLGAVSLSYFTNYWFPWAVIAGGQVPCAVAFALAVKRTRPAPVPTKTAVLPQQPTHTVNAPTPMPATQDLPEAPDYELFEPAFGKGAYGKVWLARNAIGQWQALKAVYLAGFGRRTEPYEREFNGIRRYKPISDMHPGLLRVDFVSTKKAAGYFYYVMELGDGLTPGWELNPAAYIPRDLARMRAAAPGQRLPLRECVRIGCALAEALEFLHQQGLTHRDIKPQNIIFVNNNPKLADVGLVAEILAPGKEHTYVGTPGYMPPLPEAPGTVQGDLYGLGMVLYVIRTGNEPCFFPEVSTTLVAEPEPEAFLPLNAVILKACQPEQRLRYSSAAEMRIALDDVRKRLEKNERSTGDLTQKSTDET